MQTLQKIASACAELVGQKRLHKSAFEEETKESTSSSVRGRREAKAAAKASEKVPVLTETQPLQRRQSDRTRDKPKVVYNDEEIEKLIEAKATSSGCIEVMLAHNYNPDIHDPTGWLMSEKLDGVRCYWSGSKMYTRNGNPFYAPKWWTDKLPKIALDGELWTNRDDFQKIVSIVRKQDKDNEEWKKIKFMIFDAPLVKGTFETRLKRLRKELESVEGGVCEMLKQTVCTSKEELGKLMDSILSEKGEGVMLKDPKSQYERRRSNLLLKPKSL